MAIASTSSRVLGERSSRGGKHTSWAAGAEPTKPDDERAARFLAKAIDSRRERTANYGLGHAFACSRKRAVGAGVIIRGRRRSASPGAADQSKWIFDPDSTAISVSAERMGTRWIDVRFTGVEGVLHLDPGEPVGSTCRGEIDIRRMRPGSPRLNTELRIEDFLDARHNPCIPFTARVLERTGEARFTAVAEFTVRGNTHEITLEVAYLDQPTAAAVESPHGPGDAPRIALEATARLSRRELGAPPGATPPGPAVEETTIELSAVINAVLDAEVREESEAR